LGYCTDWGDGSKKTPDSNPALDRNFMLKRHVNGWRKAIRASGAILGIGEWLVRDVK
jgi:hypothetical protein